LVQRTVVMTPPTSWTMSVTVKKRASRDTVIEKRPRGYFRDRAAGSTYQFERCAVNSHGLLTSLTSSCIREYQVSCQGYIICHFWLHVAATIQAQNQRSDVCVRDHAPIPSENSQIYTVKIVKVLGEGGFSFVYLAQDEASGVSASSCNHVRDMATDTRRVDSERVRPQKDSVSDRRRRC
jgi:hypothetical protein